MASPRADVNSRSAQQLTGATRHIDLLCHLTAHGLRRRAPSLAELRRPPRTASARTRPQDRSDTTPVDPDSGDLIITVRQTDLLAQADHLHQLGNDFTTLKDSMATLKDVQPGSELLTHLRRNVVQVHQLAGRALEGLVTLDDSQYTTLPDSRSSLMLLGGIVKAASSAAAALAFAVAYNQMFGDQLVSHRSLDAEADHQANLARRQTELPEQFDSAGRLLRRCATDCHDITHSILKSLIEHPEHRPALPDLTPAQYRALEKIANNGAVYTCSPRGDRVSVRAGDGKTIHSTPFGVLQAHRLVRLSKDGSHYAGVDVTATTAGRLALNTQQPARSSVTASAKAAPPAAPSAGRRR